MTEPESIIYTLRTGQSNLLGNVCVPNCHQLQYKSTRKSYTLGYYERRRPNDLWLAIRYKKNVAFPRQEVNPRNYVYDDDLLMWSSITGIITVWKVILITAMRILSKIEDSTQWTPHNLKPTPMTTLFRNKQQHRCTFPFLVALHCNQVVRLQCFCETKRTFTMPTLTDSL